MTFDEWTKKFDSKQIGFFREDLISAWDTAIASSQDRIKELEDDIKEADYHLEKCKKELDELNFRYGHKLADHINLCMELGIGTDADLSDVRFEVTKIRRELETIKEQRDGLLISSQDLLNETMGYSDEGPQGEGWDSKELSAIRQKMMTAIDACNVPKSVNTEDAT